MSAKNKLVGIVSRLRDRLGIDASKPLIFAELSKPALLKWWEKHDIVDVYNEFYGHKDNRHLSAVQSLRKGDLSEFGISLRSLRAHNVQQLREITQKLLQDLQIYKDFSKMPQKSLQSLVEKLGYEYLLGEKLKSEPISSKSESKIKYPAPKQTKVPIIRRKVPSRDVQNQNEELNRDLLRSKLKLEIEGLRHELNKSQLSFQKEQADAAKITAEKDNASRLEVQKEIKSLELTLKRDEQNQELISEKIKNFTETQALRSEADRAKIVSEATSGEIKARIEEGVLAKTLQQNQKMGYVNATELDLQIMRRLKEAESDFATIDDDTERRSEIKRIENDTDLLAEGICLRLD